jgi:hypothetical protein
MAVAKLRRPCQTPMVLIGKQGVRNATGRNISKFSSRRLSRKRSDPARRMTRDYDYLEIMTGDSKVMLDRFDKPGGARIKSICSEFKQVESRCAGLVIEVIQNGFRYIVHTEFQSASDPNSAGAWPCTTGIFECMSGWTSRSVSTSRLWEATSQRASGLNCATGCSRMTGRRPTCASSAPDRSWGRKASTISCSRSCVATVQILLSSGVWRRRPAGFGRAHERMRSRNSPT